MTVHNSLYESNQQIDVSKTNYSTNFEVSATYGQKQISIPVMQRKKRSTIKRSIIAK